MNESKISVRYAKALFLYAIEIHKLDAIKNDVELIYKTSLIPEFNLYLLSPITKDSEKKKFLLNLFSSSISKESASFLDLLVKNKREAYITDASRNFLGLYKKHLGIRTVELISAQEVSPEMKSKIQGLIQEKAQSKVELTQKIDASILGGFILRIDDQQYDASVATKLKKIKKSMLETTLNK